MGERMSHAGREWDVVRVNIPTQGVQAGKYLIDPESHEVAYLVDPGIGGRIRESWGGRKIGEANWVRAERLLRGGTGRTIVVSRFLAVAHSLVPVLAGTLRMPWGRYARYTAVGAVLWGLVYVGLGSAASIAIRKSAHLLGPTFTTVVVVAVVVALIVRAVRKRRRSAGEPVDGSVPAVAISVGGGDPSGGGTPAAPVRR